MSDLIDIKVYNNLQQLQYSFVLDCVLYSKEFYEVIDETLKNSYDGWHVSAELLKDSESFWSRKTYWIKLPYLKFLGTSF